MKTDILFNMIRVEAGREISSEEKLAEVKSVLSRAKSQLKLLKIKISRVDARTPDNIESTKLSFIDLRKLLQTIDYWANSQSSEPSFQEVLSDAAEINAELSQIEADFNFDSDSFQKEQTIEANKTREFTLPATDPNEQMNLEMKHGVDYEKHWKEQLDQIVNERDFLFVEASSLVDNGDLGNVDEDKYREIADRYIEFKRVTTNIRNFLNKDKDLHGDRINDLNNLFSEENTTQIGELLKAFFKEHIKKSAKETKEAKDDWPLEFATELEQQSTTIKQSLTTVNDNLNKKFNYKNPSSKRVYQEAKKNYDEQAKLIQELEKNKKLVARSIGIITPTPELSVSDVAQRQEELTDLLTFVSGVEVFALEVEHNIWEKSLYIDHPELVHLEAELSEFPPKPVGNPEDNFKTLNSHTNKLKKYSTLLSNLESKYTSDDKKLQSITRRFTDKVSNEIDMRSANALQYWKDNFDKIYSEFDQNLPTSFIKILILVEKRKIDETTDLDDVNKLITLLKGAKLRAEKQIITSGLLKLVDASQLSEYQAHIQELYWSRFGYQLDRLEDIKASKEEKLNTTSSEVARIFFEEGYSPNAPESWKNGEWRNASPSELATAIWNYVEVVILQGEARETEAFMSTDILGDKIASLKDSVKVIDLLRSFITLGTTFDGPKGEEISELGDKLIRDLTQINSILNRGASISGFEKDPNGLIAFISNPKNQMTRIDFTRTAEIGEGYLDKEGDGITTSERLLWAQQAYYAMNEPDFIGTAWLSKTDKDKPEFARNVRSRNELTIFPTATANAVDVFIKRDVIRMIAGSNDEPDWIKNPVKRKNGESLSDYAVRQRKEIQRQLKKEISRLKAKHKLKGGKVADRNYLTADEKSKIGRGHVAEQLSMNLGEYSLEPCLAEGQVMMRDESKKIITETHEVDGKLVTLPVIDSSKGPTSIFVTTRFFYNQAYRSKLTKDKSAEGSPGPRKTLNAFYSLTDTQNDRYWYIPDGESEGVTIKEATILAGTKELSNHPKAKDEFKNIPWGDAVTETERNSAWAEEVRLAIKHWDRAIKPDGLGIVWHQIVKTEPGSGGSLITFDPSIANSKLFPFFREVTYMMQRDKGLKTIFWDNPDEWQAFLAVEKYYVDKLKTDPNPAKPNRIGSLVVSDELWQDVKEKGNRVPTSRHTMIDIYDPEDDTRTRVCRYASLMPDVVRSTQSEKLMNKYELAVSSNPNNTQWDKWKKLFIGNVFIGSISSGDVESMDYNDVRAIRQLLSQEVWKAETQNALSKFAREKLSGRKEPLVYDGVGIFTTNEVMALLEVAGVPVGLIPVVKSGIQALEKFH